MAPSRSDFRRHAGLFSTYCPSSKLQLYSVGGELIWSHDGACETQQTIDLSTWTQDVGGLLWSSSKPGEQSAWPVTNDQDVITHYLIVSSDITPADRAQFYARVKPALDSIAFDLKSQLSLNSELDSMARELALRYEELNLVYHTDDEVRFLDEGRQALSALIENCNEYLNVDATVFLMPALDLCLHEGSRRNQFEMDSVTGILKAKLIKALNSAPRTIVFNDPAETEETFGFRGLMIASPVLDGNGEIAGSLVILRNADSPEFVNSDRNLLIVMSGKASKIILATYDSLTGLMRQDGFDRSLASAMARSRISSQTHALLHINVDRMHLINDTIGYKAGNRVLQAVTAVLREKLRDSDRIARLGGDEFGVIVHGCSIRHGERVAEKLCRAISKLKVECDEQVIDVSACIGVAALDKDSENTVTAHAGAEIACSVAKELGRNRWHVYRKDDLSLQARQQQMEWVSRLQDAIRNDEFCLYTQKLEPLRTATSGYHFEVLIRMLDRDGSIVPPDTFLPVAERYQLMPKLDRWIIERTLMTLEDHAASMADRKIVCSINLSGQTLMDRHFAAFVTEKLSNSCVAPSQICFEITETAAIANLDDAKRFMHEIKGLGCSFSLDDFGAGLSSFAYLRSLPVDYLKFDGTFVTPIANDETAAAMLAAMNQIGHILGLRTVAEFVQTEAVINRLRQMGVDYAQGFGISRPRPIAEELAEICGVTAPV